MQEFFFWVFAGIAVLGGLGAILYRQPLYCALSLVSAFVGLSGLYFQLKAAFPAILQIMLYAGAVMVLVVFVIMLLNRGERIEAEDRVSVTGAILALILLLPLGAILIAGIWQSDRLRPFTPAPESFGTVASTGRELFTTWLFPFEALSILLLAAMVGAVLISKKRLD